jgi:heme-degrading monooxygenase HmoA
MNRQMILVAGPYRSGTNDDPALIARNVAAMTDVSLRLFRAGHLPLMGERFSLPLIEHAGSRGVGDAVFNEIFHPIARALVGRCDACLRIGGPSAGADEMVALARQLGKPVYYSVRDIPIKDEQHEQPAAATAILEVAVLDVRPGMADEFRMAFTQAAPIIASMPGYISHQLKHCLEIPNRYLLLVNWTSLEAHTVGFRGSAEYQQWKQLLHHFYDPFPIVEHYAPTADP